VLDTDVPIHVVLEDKDSLEIQRDNVFYQIQMGKPIVSLSESKVFSFGWPEITEDLDELGSREGLDRDLDIEASVSGCSFQSSCSPTW
jgi:hypothetical protein